MKKLTIGLLAALAIAFAAPAEAAKKKSSGKKAKAKTETTKVVYNDPLTVTSCWLATLGTIWGADNKKVCR